MPKNRPEGHKVPYEAFLAVFPADLKQIGYAQLGIQQPLAEAGREIEVLEKLLQTETPPDLVERGSGTRAAGTEDVMFFCYWRDTGRFKQWQQAMSAPGGWLHGAGHTGRWLEGGVIDLNRTETLYSHKERHTGYSIFLEGVKPSDLHGYWGAARDRLAASEHDDFAMDAGIVMERKAGKGNGAVVEVTLPNNLCLIRTTQDWRHADEWERELFGKVMPSLRRGTEFLDTRPAESGCFGALFVTEQDQQWKALEKTCVVAFFRCLRDLETWTRDHPTHHAIFNAANKMMERLNGRTDLDLWHEVSIFPKGTFRAFYSKCRPETGLLGYFPTAG